jgi:hypothetical protein
MWCVGTDEREPFFSFGIGASGSGVPFHTHGAVFAEVLHGAKRWFITDPADKPVFDPNETSFRWLHRRNILPASKHLFECTLFPGEVCRTRVFSSSNKWLIFCRFSLSIRGIGTAL